MSYVHFPSIKTASYDFEYTSMHAMIDLRFTDGTYLSELGAKNTDGFTMEPDALGEEGSLNSMQWNFLETNLFVYIRLSVVLTYGFLPPSIITLKNADMKSSA